LLTLQEQSNLKLVIHQFADTFLPSYTQAERLALLEAAIRYQGKKKIQPGSVVFVYQRLCLPLNLLNNLTSSSKLAVKV
jgi:hypothetical protein